MKKLYRIRLGAVHHQTGLTAYAVAKRTGLSQTTVRKYADVEEVISSRIPIEVPILADFYGVDWRDTSIVEVIEVEEEAPDNPEVNALPDAIPA